MKKRRLSKVFLSSAALLLIVLGEVLLQLPPGPESWDGRLLVLAPAPFGIYVIWRLFLNPYVLFLESHACVNNAFSRYRIPYGSVSGCKGRRGLLVEVNGYGVIPVDAFDASFVGKKKREEIAAEFERRSSEFPQNDLRVTFSRVSTTGWPEYAGPGMTLLLFLIALTGP
ncbi:hypothetical protein AB0O64_04160 [Streptomyces sp. NPDC088341]|uniref:hypothetical protein n=1 Tax=Streptomyces sp. NPDC088341 TaxID=3154870 RepID=UPI00342B8E85